MHLSFSLRTRLITHIPYLCAIIGTIMLILHINNNNL